MKESMKILITGSTGCIGSRLMSYLTALGHTVSVQKSRNLCLIDEEVEGVDYIYHCAANIDRLKFKTDPFIDIDVNIKGTVSLFEACKERNPKATIIILSSFLVENSKDSYSNSKLYCEYMADMYNSIYNMNIKIARLTNVIGTTKQKTLINYFIKNALTDNDINIFNNENTRDYIHIDDAITGIVAVAERGIKSKVYYVGAGKSYSNQYVLDVILNKTNSKSKVCNLPASDYSKCVDVTHFSCDIWPTLDLGWTVVNDLDALINNMIWSWKNE